MGNPGRKIRHCMLLPSPGMSFNYVKLYSTAFEQQSIHCFIQQDKALPDQSGKGKNSVNQEYQWYFEIFLSECTEGSSVTYYNCMRETFAP